MAQYIVRPSSAVSGFIGGGTSPSTTATVVTNLSDNSDATTVTKSGTSPTFWRFNLAAPTIPSDEYVCRVGSSARWSGGGYAGVGAVGFGLATFRIADANPSSYFSVTSTGTGTPTTTEAGYVSTAWSLADMSTLRLSWYDNRSSSSQPSVLYYDLWSTIYTIKKATTAVSNQTSTTSYPTIAVTTTATIDWEASTSDIQNLRKVRTYVQIEFGGSGVGTGTIVAGAYTDTLFTVSGSQTVNVTLGTAIANGTYNIYSRAGRFREDGTITTETYGAWSTVATLTQSITPPSVPTLSASWDATNQRVVLTASGSSFATGSQTWELQRSSDAGVTWTGVRGASALPASVGTAADPATPLWVSGTNTSVSNDTGVYRTLSPALKLTPLAAGRVWANSTGSSILPVVGNASYKASGYFKTTSGTRNARLRFDWYDATGFISTVDGVDVAANSTGWTEATIVGTAPSNATYVIIVGTIDATTGATDYQYLDDVTFSSVAYDYEATRTVTNQYRIRAVGLVSGFYSVSAFSTVATVTPTYTTWNLKAPENSALNIVDIKVVDNPTDNLVEEMGIFRPLGSRYPVIVSGTLSGWDGDLQIVASTSAEWTSLKTILESQKVLLLESAFGWSKYIRIINGAKTVMLGSATSPRRQVSVSYVEVTAP